MDPLVFRIQRHTKIVSRISYLQKLLTQVRCLYFADADLFLNDERGLVEFLRTTRCTLQEIVFKLEASNVRKKLYNYYILVEFYTVSCCFEAVDFLLSRVDELLGDTGKHLATKKTRYYKRLDAVYKPLTRMSEILDLIWTKYWRLSNVCSENTDGWCTNIQCPCKDQILIDIFNDYVTYSKQIVSNGLEVRETNYHACKFCNLDSAFVGIGRAENLCERSNPDYIRTITDLFCYDKLTRNCIHVTESIITDKGARYERCMFLPHCE